MKSLKTLIEKVNLPYKKEINKIVIFNFLVIIFFLSLFLLLKSALLFVLCFFWIIILNILLINHYKKLEIIKNNKLKDIFIKNFMDFDGKSKVYFKKRMEEAFNELKKENLIDVKINDFSESTNFESLDNYLNFAKLFNCPEIEEYVTNAFSLLNKFENIPLINNMLLIEKIKNFQENIKSEGTITNNVFVMIGISILVLILTISGVKLLG